jgi:hypothetical protein
MYPLSAVMGLLQGFLSVMGLFLRIQWVKGSGILEMEGKLVWRKREIREEIQREYGSEEDILGILIEKKKKKNLAFRIFY